MASLARRLAPAAALGGLAVVIVGVADPALAGRTEGPVTGTTTTAAGVTPQATATAEPTTGVQTEDAPTVETPATTTATCANGEGVTGDSAMTQWGPVQVTATVADGRVCAVQAVTWPANDRKSQMINAYAIPELDAMASDSPTQFDYVSGATYTSQAYHDSLQSILDAL